MNVIIEKPIDMIAYCLRVEAENEEDIQQLFKFYDTIKDQYFPNILVVKAKDRIVGITIGTPEVLDHLLGPEDTKK